MDMCRYVDIYRYIYLEVQQADVVADGVGVVVGVTDDLLHVPGLLLLLEGVQLDAARHHVHRQRQLANRRGAVRSRDPAARCDWSPGPRSSGPPSAPSPRQSPRRRRSVSRPDPWTEIM